MGSAKLLTYKQAIKYPVGTIFQGARGNLYVVTGDGRLLGIEGDNMGHRGQRKWDNGVGYFTHVPKDAVPKEPTIAEVCEERGWRYCRGFPDYHFYPDTPAFHGNDEMSPSKVARIIDIIEEK